MVDGGFGGTLREADFWPGGQGRMFMAKGT